MIHGSVKIIDAQGITIFTAQLASNRRIGGRNQGNHSGEIAGCGGFLKRNLKAVLFGGAEGGHRYTSMPSNVRISHFNSDRSGESVSGGIQGNVADSGDSGRQE